MKLSNGLTKPILLESISFQEPRQIFPKPRGTLSVSGSDDEKLSYGKLPRAKNFPNQAILCLGLRNVGIGS